jgi:hypothetical protein
MPGKHTYLEIFFLVLKSPQGRLLTDPQLRVIAAEGQGVHQELLDGGRVFAVGDCATSAVKPLPALAQVKIMEIVCSRMGCMTDRQLIMCR